MKKNHIHVLLVGGGSGGHVTPLKALSDVLLKDSDAAPRVSVIVDRGFATRARSLFSESNVSISTIFAGKLRRYHSKSFLWHVLHLPTLLKNLRDVFYLAIGLLQSVVYILRDKPSVVFCKGGFVCVPVGVAAKALHIPLVIHDSDTRPGLTNRFLSRWAQKIATGMPIDFYPYKPEITTYTGIPVSSAYKPIGKIAQQQHKVALGFKQSQPLLLITGGGNGADSLNKKMQETVGELLSDGWGIVHMAGKDKVAPLETYRRSLNKHLQKDWQLEEFADMVPRLLAADVVVARTSASTLQECANAKKVVIGIPSPHLDDQAMNARYFASKDAILSVDQDKVPNQELIELVRSARTADSQERAQTLHTLFARPEAAAQIAQLILDTARAR